MSGDRVATIAFCWRIERRDGMAIGLTDHDRDLHLDGLRYRSAPGMTPSAIVRAEGLDTDTMDVAGALTSGAISEDDLIAGRWDGARVDVFAIDWTTLAGRIDLGSGRLGTVETADQGFTAELRGRADALERPVAAIASPECRADLGDRACRVAMPARRHWACVTAVDDLIVTTDRAEPVADGFGGGAVRWMSGANTGLESAIASSADHALMLRTPPPYPIETGVLVRLTEGCDKSFATCVARFANAANFRGEPFVPGIDLLMRYPDA